MNTEQLWRRRTLTELHQGLTVPLLVPAPTLFPHTGVVRLGVFVLHPTGSGRNGDDVENNSEQQQQRNYPPAPGVRDSTAEHDRGESSVERTEKERESGWSQSSREGEKAGSGLSTQTG